MKANGLRLLTALLALALLMTVIPAAAPVAAATSSYYIEVDITNQIVTVYDNNNRTESGIVAQMICSTGASSGSTPVGTFTMPKPWYSTERKQWYYFSPGTWGQYASRIVGHILFHSYLYSSKGSAPIKSTVAALGSPASHGCVRLRPEDAKWIAENALPGTVVRIYRSGKVNESLRAALLTATWYRSSGTPKPPTRDYLTLGDTGDKVTSLQKDLITLKLYSGSASGTYDQATADAVKTFQVYTHLTASGDATPETVAAVASRAAEVAAQFGSADYRPVFSGSTENLAKVKTKGTVKLYKSSQTTSGVVGSLNQGDVVTVRKKGNNWTIIEKDGLTGYCQNTHLTYYTNSTEKLDYELVAKPTAAPTPVPTPEATAAPTPTPTPTPTATPAPTFAASGETLAEGSKGDAVRNLQYGLTALRLYSGALSGTFDAATADALRLFQTSAGLKADGVATPAVQKALFEKASALSKQFPDGNYRAIIKDATVQYATVTTRGSTLNVRARSNTASEIVGKLRNGAKVLVTKKGKNWSVIQSGSVTGYCKNAYLRFSTDAGKEIAYEPTAAAILPFISAAEEAPVLPVEIVETEPEAVAPAEEVVPETPALLYAVIVREEVKVYREAETDEDAVLATPACGSFYTVVERGEAWTKIELEPQRYGYVRSEDVEFTAVKPEIVVDAPEEEAEAPLEVEAAEEAVEAEEIPVEDENEDTVEPEQEEE